MGAIKDLIDTTGIPAMTSAVGGAVGNQIGYGLGELTGYNKALERDQLKQQQKLTDMQSAANLGLMKESYREQKSLWDATSAEAQISHLKNAGLNPALMYAKGGTGGSTGGGGASVGGGQASNTAAMQQANTGQLMAGMGMQKMLSEIDLNKAHAEALRADATKKSGVDTDLATVQTENLKIQNEISSATKDTVIETAKQGLKNLTASYDNIISNTNKNESEIKTIEATRDAQVSELIARAALQKSGVQLNNQHIELMKKQVNELIHNMIGREIHQEQEDQRIALIAKELELKFASLDWTKTAFTVSQAQDAIKSIAQIVAGFVIFGKGTAQAGKAAADRMKQTMQSTPGRGLGAGF